MSSCYSLDALANGDELRRQYVRRPAELSGRKRGSLKKRKRPEKALEKKATCAQEETCGTYVEKSK